MIIEPADKLYPRAVYFVEHLDRDALLAWLKHYPIGRAALKALDQKLNTPEPARLTKQKVTLDVED